MKNHHLTLAALPFMLLGLGACTPEQRAAEKAPGTYVRTESTTDEHGTTTVKESTVEVTVDEDGTRRERVTSKVTSDPKGLLNKTTKKKTTQVIEKQ